MSVQRHVFSWSTDTGGDAVDTGPPITGLILAVRSDTGIADTGCDFLLQSVNTGMVICDYDNVGGSSWTRVPRCLSFDTGGAALGDQYFPIAHDRLRLTVTQSDGATGSLTGKFYVWTGW